VKVGSVIVREHQGKLHEVLVVPNRRRGSIRIRASARATALAGGDDSI
jgi:hypothetical protein